MKHRYRLSNEGDVPELMKLWSRFSGWGDADPGFWNHIFKELPSGPAEIVVTEHGETNEIVGQLAFLPCFVSAAGREVRAARPFAPIMTEAARSSLRLANPLAHPMLGMYRTAIGALRSIGYGLFWMVPDPRWMRLFGRIPFLKSCDFPLWSRELPFHEDPSLPPEFRQEPLSEWGSEIDELSKKNSTAWDCSVVRDRETLRWKVGQGDYHVTSIRRGEELVGLVASREKGDRQWLICDMLVADAGDSLRATLTAACRVGLDAARNAPKDAPIGKLGVLALPKLQPVLEELGFRPDDYRFSLVVQVLDKTLDADDLAPGRWYVSAND